MLGLRSLLLRPPLPGLVCCPPRTAAVRTPPCLTPPPAALHLLAYLQEQDEVQRLREQLELMTAERDRLLAELQQGGDASFFVLDR